MESTTVACVQIWDRQNPNIKDGNQSSDTFNTLKAGCKIRSIIMGIKVKYCIKV